MRPFGVARYAEHRTRLVDGDGRVFAGHLDESAGGVPRAVVVIHDFYGLTQPVRTAATRLAADGFVVFAPDLYRGRVATSPADAGALDSGLYVDASDPACACRTVGGSPRGARWIPALGLALLGLRRRRRRG